jgi:hypothetical protein
MDVPRAQPQYPPCPLASEGKAMNQEIPGSDGTCISEVQWDTGAKENEFGKDRGHDVLARPLSEDTRLG